MVEKTQGEGKASQKGERGWQSGVGSAVSNRSLPVLRNDDAAVQISKDPAGVILEHPVCQIDRIFQILVDLVSQFVFWRI